MQRSALAALGLIAALMSPAGVAAAASHDPEGHGLRHPHRAARFHERHAPADLRELGPLAFLLHDVDLTAEQRDQIESLVTAHCEARAERHAEFFDHDDADRQLEIEFDEVAVRARAEQRARIRIEAEVEHARLRSAVLALLTPDQLARVRETHERFTSRHDQFRDRQRARRPRR